MATDPLDAIFTKEDRAFFPKARYRLTEQHFSEEDKLLEPETLVGTGTTNPDGQSHAWTRPPTPGMVGLDERSQGLVDKVTLAGDGLNPIDKLPIVVDQAVVGVS
jgi:hypothetical protein